MSMGPVPGEEPTGVDLLAALEAVDEPDPGARFSAAWDLLAHAPDRETFEVALDLALERGLIPMEFGALIRGRWESDEPAPTWVNPVDRSEMIWIAPGPFYVGEERRRAESPGFFLARHPVTNAQYQRFIDATGYTSPENDPVVPGGLPTAMGSADATRAPEGGPPGHTAGSPSSTRSTTADGPAWRCRRNGSGKRRRGVLTAARSPGAKRPLTTPRPAVAGGSPRSARRIRAPSVASPGRGPPMGART